MPQATTVRSSTWRSEKERQLRAFALRKQQQVQSLADYVEKFLASPAHIHIHWVLNEWRSVLLVSTPNQVASILRDDSPDTESLRDSPPYFGPPDRSA